MIRIENTTVNNIARAIYSARNAMNSWDKSDSDLEHDTLGENDLRLARNLVKAGSDHRKFLRYINVTCDITAPLYWWKQFSTYRIGVVQNSTSTMHKIHAKEFTLEDFSTEHLYNQWDQDNSDFKYCLENVIAHLNQAREKYIETNVKGYWWQMIQLLPSSYNQRRTVQLNYEVLLNMYHARKKHKLDCWRDFCKWVETLPYAKELICNVD